MGARKPEAARQHVEHAMSMHAIVSGEVTDPETGETRTTTTEEHNKLMQKMRVSVVNNFLRHHSQDRS